MARGEQAGHTARDFDALIDAFPIVKNLLVAEADRMPVGLLSPDHHLIVVNPGYRLTGIGRSLLAAAERQLATSDDGPLILFPPHGNAGALAFLDAIGFCYDHTLYRFQRPSAPGEMLPALPDRLQLIGYDDSLKHPYIDLINATFADHPTPLRVTVEQIDHIHASSDFDPTAIAILQTDAGSLVAFCTTGANLDTNPPSGSIRLVGVRRDVRGRGLGRWLLLWGIGHLRDKGFDTIELLVEGENENALALYRSVGFEAVEEWPQWMRAESP